ncbi:N-6 DNA methylase [Amycolatopsis sp. NPDC003861]
MPIDVARDAVERLATRSGTRTEADVQADVYLLLTSGALALEPTDVARLEVQLGDGSKRRIDVEIGHCVIEVKKDLRIGGVRKQAETQLAGYVRDQSLKLGVRYVGILTDGTEWYLYHLRDDELHQAAKLQLNPQSPEVDRLIVWLESILATQDAIIPTPVEITRRLGADSPAHQLDHLALSAIYAKSQHSPEIRLKRDLWAKLLRTAFGKAFSDDEKLFLDHTLLVLTAEIIAHAVVGFDISPTGGLTPTTLARGTEFGNALIYGVVEADFFDWVLVAPGGQAFIAELARRISRFDWSLVKHDVLKVLYESVISKDLRVSLGEYYTPDWLANRMVDDTVQKPLEQKVLDPACGSGTFLFHAVRKYLESADAAGISNEKAVSGVTHHVYGMDIHPVAVTLARVTYLLAIGPSRLAASDRPAISVPVYLGDSVQWEQRTDLLSDEDRITISTSGTDLVEGGGALFGDDLVFPRSILEDAGDFDRLVTAMADKALDMSSRKSRDLIAPTLRQFGIHSDDYDMLATTFEVMRRLHSTGRNHIWGYYVRNLIRPIWLTHSEQQVDVLVGNPPWLRYNKMTSAMQERYITLSKDRGLLTGGLGASSRDLSTLFAARCIELYLKLNGKFSFVMPHGTMTRKPHTGFRAGKWGSDLSGPVNSEFSSSWDLSKVNTGFPNHSCVVRGQRSKKATEMPSTVRMWAGKLKSSDTDWSTVAANINISDTRIGVLKSGERKPESPYKKRFRNGAILYPRVLMFVDETSTGPLGAGAGRVAVRSRRTNVENPPWKEVPSLSGAVERAFVRPVHLGETVLPYRLLRPLRAVVPANETEILSAPKVDEIHGLSQWWTEAEKIWGKHKAQTEERPLLERIDEWKQLSSQLPAAKHRIVYNKSGNMLVASRLEDSRCLVENGLYWAATSTISEARYLTAVLNSEAIMDKIKPLLAIGLFGLRHIDKNVFSAEIPTYDSKNQKHVALAALAEQAESVAADVDLENTGFQKARRLIMAKLKNLGIAQQIEHYVGEIVPTPNVERYI